MLPNQYTEEDAIPTPWFEREGRQAMETLGERIGKPPLVWASDASKETDKTPDWFFHRELEADRKSAAQVIAKGKAIPQDAFRRKIWQLACGYATAAIVASQYKVTLFARKAPLAEVMEAEELRAKIRRARILLLEGAAAADNSADGGPVLRNMMGQASKYPLAGEQQTPTQDRR